MHGIKWTELWSVKTVWLHIGLLVSYVNNQTEMMYKLLNHVYYCVWVSVLFMSGFVKMTVNAYLLIPFQVRIVQLEHNICFLANMCSSWWMADICVWLYYPWTSPVNVDCPLLYLHFREIVYLHDLCNTCSFLSFVGEYHLVENSKYD